MVAEEKPSVDLALYAPDASPNPEDAMLTNPFDGNGVPTDVTLVKK